MLARTLTELIAASVVDPHKSAQATVTVLAKPPWTGWTAGLMPYLTAVFCLVFLSINFWPPGLYDRGEVEKARNARIVAEANEQESSAAQNAAEDRKKALVDEKDMTERLRSSEDGQVRVPGGTGSREVNLLWMEEVAGALGSFVYSARSCVDFVGNRMIRASWSAWYLLYPLIGAALAPIFYLVVRGGFLSGVTKGSDLNI